MANSVNKVILIGNLARDPEVRSTPSGDRVANMTVATSNAWTDKVSGERRGQTEWNNVVVWNERSVDFAEKYLKKGAKVYVEGTLKTRKWTKDNVDHYTTEIVIERFNGTLTDLSGKNDSDDQNNMESNSDVVNTDSSNTPVNTVANRANTSNVGRVGRKPSMSLPTQSKLDDEVPF